MSMMTARQQHPCLDLEESLWEQGVKTVAGFDEAGRGALAGPLVVAAVGLQAGQTIPKGINDSKKIAAGKRQRLAMEIVRENISFGLAVVSPLTIDRIGIQPATQKGFRLALNELNPTPQFLLSDAYPIREVTINQRAVIRGDQQIMSIAAASILAKVYRDWLMENTYHPLYPHYNFSQHKGYGTKEHRRIIIKQGPCPIHRRSYLERILQD